ncbi:MAG: phospho-N-acetylmuramoyl-pentapeptide-transferase [Clostridia bacterium]|nr:phospho-N-acetylmuramoyl-pentapeptide-transferase [Clostridia bacterium]
MNAILAFVTSLVITAVSGLFIIPWLRRLKFGQTILEDGPTWHMAKQGTPVMGGLMFILGTGISTILFSIPDFLTGDFRALLIFLTSLAFGAIGFSDDLVKVTKKQNKGLTALQKMILQVAVSALFLVALQFMGGIDGNLFVPFVGVEIKLPWILFVILAAIFVTGTDNATNLTDGVDGLLSGTTLPIMIFFALAGSFVLTGGAASVTIPAAAMAGGLIGFLIYNYHPAKVFMGDTGSLFIGGMVASMGFVAGNPLILVLVGLIYYWTVLSVMLQVGYFKLTHGKRIFKMAPFHHHLEKSGWNEYKLFWVYTLVTAVLCAIGWFGIA